MTLPAIHVDCKNISTPGQLGVALGRCQSSKRIHLENFSDKCIVAQPRDISEFYHNVITPNFSDNFTCCRNCLNDLENPQDETPVLQVKWDLRNDWLPALAPTAAQANVANPDLESDSVHALITEISLQTTINSVTFENPHTNLQQEINGIAKNIDVQKMKQFTNILLKSFDEMAENVQDLKKQCNITLFYSRCNRFLQSKFQNYYKPLFGDVPMTPAHKHISFRLISKIRHHYVSKKFHHVEEASSYVPNCPQRNFSGSDEQRAKLRYVIAYGVAKVLHRTSRHIQSVKKSTIAKTRQQLETLLEQRNILRDLKIPQGIILETTEDLQSLEEIQMKQNINNGLTHVTDVFFTFSQSVINFVLPLLTFNNLEQHAGDIYVFVLNSMTGSQELFVQFCKNFDQSYSRNNTSLVFKKILNLFSKVITNQLRADYLEHKENTKSIALRKETSNTNKSKRTKPQSTAEAVKARKSKRKAVTVITCPECQQPEQEDDEE